MKRTFETVNLFHSTDVVGNHRIYYQFDKARLSVCTLTVHGLLHIAQDIRSCAPSWVTWTFYVERCCGELQRGLRSKKQPWSNLNKRVTRIAYLEQLAVRFDLDEELSTGENTSELSRGERIFVECMHIFLCKVLLTYLESLINLDPKSILRTPRNVNFSLSASLRRKIAGYFQSVLGGTRTTIENKLPTVMTSWGKVRIKDGGDAMRSSSASGSDQSSERNSSFVRVSHLLPMLSPRLIVISQYELIVRDADDASLRTIFYGQLQRILEYDVPDDNCFGAFRGTKRLLAVIMPCATNGKDATKELTSYSRTTGEIVTDLRAIEAVVGRVKSRKKWWIIDRTDGSGV
jgi:hypothetical protein